MGQGDILVILQKSDGWLTTKEIAKASGTAISSALVKLRKLKKQGDIIVKELKNGYKYKINNGK